MAQWEKARSRKPPFHRRDSPSLGLILLGINNLQAGTGKAQNGVIARALFFVESFSAGEVAQCRPAIFVSNKNKTGPDRSSSESYNTTTHHEHNQTGSGPHAGAGQNTVRSPNRAGVDGKSQFPVPVTDRGAADHGRGSAGDRV